MHALRGCGCVRPSVWHRDLHSTHLYQDSIQTLQYQEHLNVFHEDPRLTEAELGRDGLYVVKVSVVTDMLDWSQEYTLTPVQSNVQSCRLSQICICFGAQFEPLLIK